MTTPKFNTAFDLKLSRDCKWPLVTRDGRKAELCRYDGQNYPLLGFVLDSEYGWNADRWLEDGSEYRGSGESEGDLLLSSDLTDPAVQRAVEAAAKAGEPISFLSGVYGKWMPVQGNPFWKWSDQPYMVSRLLPATPYWSEAKHLPLGCLWICTDGDDKTGTESGGSLVIGVTKFGVNGISRNGQITLWTWQTLERCAAKWSPTRGQGTWKPCTVEGGK